MIDQKCKGCTHQIETISGCALDTEDDSPCFHYDHYTSEEEFTKERAKLTDDSQS
jgi:hypothetical protein